MGIAEDNIVCYDGLIVYYNHTVLYIHKSERGYPGWLRLIVFGSFSWQTG